MNLGPTVERSDSMHGIEVPFDESLAKRGFRLRYRRGPDVTLVRTLQGPLGLTAVVQEPSGQSAVRTVDNFCHPLTPTQYEEYLEELGVWVKRGEDSHEA